MSAFDESRLSGFPAALLDWYRENARDLPWRHTRDPYRIWISEIMLQQTRVAAVIGYYRRFLDAFPTAEALAAGDEEALLSVWQGLGYYSRARNLQKAAKIIVERGGFAEYGGFPRSYEAFLSLPGVGEYTAGAIASAAFALPVPAVDGNVLRVLSRVTDCHETIDSPAVKRRFRELLAELFPKLEEDVPLLEEDVPPLPPLERGGNSEDVHKRGGSSEDIRIFNQSVMELGATVCVPNGPPQCERCPVAAWCLGRERGTAAALPIRNAKKDRRVEDRTVFVLLRRDGQKKNPNDGKNADNTIQIALRKRPNAGLLARLWEFPNVSGTLEEARAAQTVQDWGLRVLDWHSRLQAKHIFTHVEWHMTGYVLTVEEAFTVEEAGEGIEAEHGTEAENFQWADQKALRAFAIPSAFARFREAAEKQFDKVTERGRNDDL